jgi:hypothetical protein
MRNDPVTDAMIERSRSSSLSGQVQQQPIILPPLTSLAGNMPVRTSVTGNSQPQPQQAPQTTNYPSQPSSPGGTSFFKRQDSQNAPQQAPVPPGAMPQGLFLKVPYQGSFERRESVDSVSSSLSDARFSTGSNGSSGAFAPRFNYESSVISDSDDDLSGRSHRSSIDMRARSRSNSANFPAPSSPALSLSSLKSFSQGFSQGVNLTNPQHATMQQQNQQAQLVELYYQFVHPSFSILPLNKQSLGNLLNIPQPPPQVANEVTEANQFVIHCFYSSLDVLISTTSRSPRSPSAIGTGSAPNNVLDSLNQLFSNLFKVSSKITSNLTLFSQNAVILVGISLVSLCYSVLLLGAPSDVNINTTVGVFNKLKIFKLFWDKNHIVTNNNYDDYTSILKRLYISLAIIDSLQAIGFGTPTSMSMDLDVDITDKLFPNFANFDLTKNNMLLGIKISQICNLRNLSESPALSVGSPICNAFKAKLKIFNDILNRNEEQDMLTWAFWDLIMSKYELESFFEEVVTSNTGKVDDELIYDYQLKCLRLTKKHLSIQGNLLTVIKNNTNSIDQGLLVSPFLPLIFKQSIKAINISKVIINSLQTNRDLVTRLSKRLNEVISLTNFLSLLKPFKNEEMNNHLKFDFKSIHLDWLENEDRPLDDDSQKLKSLNRWVSLITDVYEFMKSDDYDGWY